MLTKTALFATLVALVTAQTPSPATSIVLNGGFELDPGGSTTITDWSSSDQLTTQTSSAIVHSGNYALAVGADPSSPEVLSQVLPAETGLCYQLSFWYYNAVPGGNYVFDVALSNVAVSLDVSQNAGNGQYQGAVFNVLGGATQAADTLTFTIGSDVGFIYLDDVVVSQQDQVNCLGPSSVPRARRRRRRTHSAQW